MVGPALLNLLVLPVFYRWFAHGASAAGDQM
jgi:hypothetical protein